MNVSQALEYERQPFIPMFFTQAVKHGACEVDARYFRIRQQAEDFIQFQACAAAEVEKAQR